MWKDRDLQTTPCGLETDYRVFIFGESACVYQASGL